MKVPRALLPRQEREVIRICDDLNTYWRTNDNFVVALERYLEDLNFKYKLGLSSEEVHEIPNKLVFVLFNDCELSNANTIYIFAQYIIFFIFKGVKPRNLQIDGKDLLQKTQNIRSYLVSPETNIGGFRAVVDKRFG